MSTLDYRDRIRDEIPESYNTSDNGILLRFMSEALYPSAFNIEESVFEQIDTSIIPDYNNQEINDCNEFIENMWGSLFDVYKHDRESWDHYANRLVQCVNGYNSPNTEEKLEYIVSGSILGVINVSLYTQSAGTIACSFSVEYLVDNPSQTIDVTVVKAKYQKMVSGLLNKYIPAGIVLGNIICSDVTKVTEYDA